MKTRVSLTVLCISLFAASAQAQTVWYVNDDGDPDNDCQSWSDACPELQTALSMADDGDQIVETIVAPQTLGGIRPRQGDFVVIGGVGRVVGPAGVGCERGGG